jgi:hypothetical protein
MEIRVSPKSLLLALVLALLAVGALFAARALAARPAREDPDIEVAKRAVIQIQAMRKGETYDALSPELAERFRRDAERLPDSERDRHVEILGAALVRKGDGFSEVAVVARVSNPKRPQAPPLETRAFIRVQGGKAVRIYPVMP